MDLDLLRTFLILSQTKSFSKTAELQNVVQSTITMRIYELEKIVGKPLFYRSNRKVELSESGSMLVPYADRMLKLHEESLKKINSAQFFDGRLVIASVESTLRYLLLPVMKEFLAQFPQTSINCMASHSPEIAQLLVDGIVDIGFVTLPPRLSRFDTVTCYEDEIILVVSPKHPLSRQASVSIQQLPELDLAYISWARDFREWISQVFPPNHLFRFQMDPSPLLLLFVKEGLGPALVIKSAVREELNSGELVQIPLDGHPQPPPWKSYVVIPHHKKDDPPVKNWFRLMAQAGFQNLDYWK